MGQVKIDNVDQAVALAKALAHELRVEILVAHANKGLRSATDISREVSAFYSASHVSYHQLILRDLGVLELIESHPVRGGIEKHYGLTPFGIEAVRIGTIMGKWRDAEG